MQIEAHDFPRQEPMRHFIRWLRKHARLDGGTTAVEYAVLLALILLLAVAAVQVLGCNVSMTLNNAARSIGS